MGCIIHIKGEQKVLCALYIEYWHWPWVSITFPQITPFCTFCKYNCLYCGNGEVRTSNLAERLIITSPSIGLRAINRPQRGRGTSHMTNFNFCLPNHISWTTEATLFNFILMWEGCKVLWWVCMSVCLSVHSHNSKTTWPNFCVRCTWPWLNPLLAALWYVIYFWFCLQSCTSHPTPPQYPHCSSLVLWMTSFFVP